MTLTLLITSTPTTSLYELKGKRAVSHKAAHYPTEGDTALVAAVKGLQSIRWHRAVYDETGNTRWTEHRLPITIKANAEFIEACKALEELEDTEGLPEEAQQLHSLLRKFEVTWGTAANAEETKLKEWADKAAA